MRDLKLYLQDILDAIEAIESFVRNMDFEEFKQSDLVSSAVLRKFEIMGEAAKKVPISILQNYADIPWQKIAGLRDRLIHFYFGVKYELVWDTIKNELPELKPKIQKILMDLDLS